MTRNAEKAKKTISNDVVEGITKHGSKLLMRLAMGKKATRQEDGHVKVAGLIVPDACLTMLVDKDLIVFESRDVLLTQVGRMAARRLQSLEASKQSGAVAKQKAFRGQHHIPGVKRVIEGAGSTVRRINIGESPLGWYLNRKDKNGKPLITRDQYNAGERLRADFERASMRQRLTINYEMRTGGKGHQRRAATPLDDEGSLAARKRLEAALVAVGPGLSDSLVRVCCYLEGLEAAEQNLGWPTRSGKVVLSIALDRLNQYYNNQIG